MAAKIEAARPDCKVELHGESDQLGMFKVEEGARSLWDKYETGEFPEAQSILDQLPEPPGS